MNEMIIEMMTAIPKPVWFHDKIRERDAREKKCHVVGHQRPSKTNNRESSPLFMLEIPDSTAGRIS
jgi:hypothetical protein